MDRSSKLLVAALVRPLNLVALGAGLLLALTFAPWWVFPASFVPYAIMVMLALRDRSFVESAVRGERETDTGEPIEWAVLREFGRADYAAPLQRIATSEQKLSSELASAPEGARAVMATTLAQLRSAALLGIELARRLQKLDATLRTYPAANPQNIRREADERRRRAAMAIDAQASASLLDAAKSMDESAKTAEALFLLRERLSAQLESLAASLESVAVRSIRLRVASPDGAGGDMNETLRVDIDAVKETLSVFEESDLGESSEAKGGS
jgi:hypothetical protein